MVPRKPILALWLLSTCALSCQPLSAPGNAQLSCDQSGSPLPVGTRCSYSCSPGYAIGGLWSHDRYDGSAKYAVSEKAPWLHEPFKGVPERVGAFEQGARPRIADVIHRVCRNSGEWSGEAPRCYSLQAATTCINGIFPRCASRVSDRTRITITGANFNVHSLSVIFNDLNVLRNGTIHDVRPNQIIVTPAQYLEHNNVPFPYQWYQSRNQVPYANGGMNKTAKGTLVVLANGEPVRNCADIVGLGHARRIFEFSYSVGWPANAPLLVTDYVGDRILQIDPDTGIGYTLIDAAMGFPLKRPYGVDIGPDGALYVGAGGPRRGRILRYNMTGEFLGIWTEVPGEPRGLRWRGDCLYVASWHENRVLKYRHNLARVNWEVPNEMQNNHATFQGAFTQDLSKGSPEGARLTNPYELRFHPIHGHVKLFVSSAATGSVLQFHGDTGQFERVFSQKTLKALSGFSFGFSKESHDMYAVGAYAGKRILRFNGTTGEVVAAYKDDWLVRPAGLVTYDASIFMSATDEIREYSTKEGVLIKVATKHPKAEFTFITVAAQCN